MFLSGKDRHLGGGEITGSRKPDKAAAKPSSSNENQSDSNVWSGPAKISEEKTQEEEFEEYFDDMFL